MKKVISFSLWGDNPKYTIGAIKNAELAPFIYTGWEVWFYVANSVPHDIVSELETKSKVIHRKNGNWDSMVWRFEPISDTSVDVFISRDTDSRLNYRERRAVDAWLVSDKRLHLMRDHSWHGTHILGGMWGFKGTVDHNINDLYKQFIHNKGSSNHYDVDQQFLAQTILENFKDDCLIHDELFSRSPFPTPREDNEYVGAPYDANNNLEIEFVGK